MRRKWLIPVAVLLALVASQAIAQNNGGAAAPRGSKEQATKGSESYDPLLDLPPLPANARATLIGGTVRRIDQIRNWLVLEPFGAKPIKVSFDQRTRIYRDAAETTQAAIRPGERVYVDTILDGTRIFAKNIRVVTGARSADARGQVVRFDPKTGDMVVQDELSSQPVSFRVTDSTQVNNGGSKISAAEVRPGALVTVKFSSDGRRDVARQVSVLAMPGTTFTFFGTITYLNLSTRTFAVANQSDKKTYDLTFDPASVTRDQLKEGAQVLVKATFNGTGYTAQKVQFVRASLQ